MEQILCRLKSLHWDNDSKREILLQGLNLDLDLDLVLEGYSLHFTDL